MSQERGRQQKDKLEQISNEYSALHTIFKKLTSYEEELSILNVGFAQKWIDIQKTEENPNLNIVIGDFAEAIKKSEEFRKESLSQIKNYIQEPLKVYPLKIKKQKRSLSRNARGSNVDDRQSDDIEEKIRNFDDVHVADMKQLMLHLINAEMFFHSKGVELFSKSYKSLCNDLD